MTTYLKKGLALSLLLAGSVQAGVAWVVKDSNGQLHAVQPAYVDRELRDIPADKLNEVLPHMAILPVKMDNGEYAIHGHVRVLGGGPIFGTICYWGTKAVGYGGIAVAVFFDPPLVLEAPLLLETVESAATLAGIAGTMAPTA